jgi:hypothetical protein
MTFRGFPHSKGNFALYVYMTLHRFLLIFYIIELAFPYHLLAFHLPAAVSGSPLAEFRLLIRIPGEWSRGEAGIPRKGRGKIRITGEG